MRKYYFRNVPICIFVFISCYWSFQICEFFWVLTSAKPCLWDCSVHQDLPCLLRLVTLNKTSFATLQTPHTQTHIQKLLLPSTACRLSIIPITKCFYGFNVLATHWCGQWTLRINIGLFRAECLNVGMKVPFTLPCKDTIDHHFIHNCHIEGIITKCNHREVSLNTWNLNENFLSCIHSSKKRRRAEEMKRRASLTCLCWIIHWNSQEWVLW